MQTLTLTPESFTIQHVNLRNFSSVSFTYSGITPERGTTVTVQEPLSLISRRDGRWTIKARNPQNTRTINLTCGRLVMVPYVGKRVTALIK